MQVQVEGNGLERTYSSHRRGKLSLQEESCREALVGSLSEFG